MSDDDVPEVTKASGYLPISLEALGDAARLVQAEIERAELLAHYRRKEAERLAGLRDANERLLDVAGSLARKLLDLHSMNVSGDCKGDEYEGYEAEAPLWPCDTVRAIAEYYGVELP